MCFHIYQAAQNLSIVGWFAIFLFFFVRLIAQIFGTKFIKLILKLVTNLCY